MEEFITGLKAVFAGTAVISVVFVICFFLVRKFNKDTGHGMPGMLTIMTGILAAVIFAITVFILIWKGEHDLILLLKIASGIGLGFGTVITFIELI